MRLIDADKLKAIPCEIHNGALTDLCVPLYQINNAPTVHDTVNLYPSGEVIIQQTRPQAKTNADLFEQTFGVYATEIWSMSESQFLEWLNEEVKR